VYCVWRRAIMCSSSWAVVLCASLKCNCQSHLWHGNISSLTYGSECWYQVCADVKGWGVSITTNLDGAVHVAVQRRLMFLADDKLKNCWVAKFQMLKLTYNFIHHVSEWKIVYKAAASRWYDTRSYIWTTHAIHDCKNIALRLAVTSLPSSFAFSENYTKKHIHKISNLDYFWYAESIREQYILLQQTAITIFQMRIQNINIA
jgi:hypothetical protein